MDEPRPDLRLELTRALHGAGCYASDSTIDRVVDVVHRCQPPPVVLMPPDIPVPSELHAACIELAGAVLDVGPNPNHHQAVMARHRQEWPTLWRAIDGIINVPRGPAKPRCECEVCDALRRIG